jgi:hypothetical protein
MWWTAPAAQPFRVESSADLHEWRTETVVIDYAAGRYRAVLPWDAASNARFYRVVWTQ